MNRFIGAVSAEARKCFRSPMFWVSMGIAVFLPLMMSLIMFVVKNPEAARGMGIITVKARIAGLTADWQSYISFSSAGFAGLSMFLLGFAACWIFGREYSDRTVKDLLALPISRAAVVTAKFAVLLVWALCLYAVFLCASLLAGSSLSLPGFDPQAAKTVYMRLFAVGFMAFWLSLVTAFIASAARGYLAATGVLVFLMAMINFSSFLGMLEVYPWAVPMILADSRLMNADLIAASWISVGIAGFLGALATYLWWRYADQM